VQTELFQGHPAIAAEKQNLKHTVGHGWRCLEMFGYIRCLVFPQVAMLPPAEQQKVLDMVQALSSPSALASNFAVDGLITVMPSDESKKWLQLRQVAGQVTVHDVLLG
jgi:hypothetical protein